MTSLSSDFLSTGGIEAFGRDLRGGKTTIEETVAAYLTRIDALNSKLGAFAYIAREEALTAARAVDALLASGTDLGPLMGVPVAVKDTIAVEGMPTGAGSNLDVTDLIGLEGPFVRTLRQAGCIIIGKTAAEEFARGGPLGLNPIAGTPWNPWDSKTHRITGGSSSGSGVAMGAGLCGFAIGTDTGGSVRLPASYCGTFGLCPTWGTWSNQGVYPTCPSLDVIGILTRSAADASIVYATLTKSKISKPAALRGTRLGRPSHHFFEDLDSEVGKCVNSAIAALETAGVEIVEIDIPEILESDSFFRVVIGAEFLAGMGRERFQSTRDKMGFIVQERIASGLDVTGDEYFQQKCWQASASRRFAERCEGLDGIISPTIPFVAAPVSDFPDLESATKLALPVPKNTYFVNMLRLCGTSIPAHGFGAKLPVGLQIACAGNEDAKALSISLAVEEQIGPQPRPDLSAFCD